MKEKLKSIGITNFMFMPCQPINKGDETYPTKIVKRDLHKFDAGRVAKCNGCYDVIAINSDGNIFPCQALIKNEFKITSIFREKCLKTITWKMQFGVINIGDSNLERVIWEV